MRFDVVDQLGCEIGSPPHRGRRETLVGIADLPKWKGLSSIILVESERTVRAETSRERRYYWSSHVLNAAALAAMIRGHWGIENQLRGN